MSHWHPFPWVTVRRLTLTWPCLNLRITLETIKLFKLMFSLAVTTTGTALQEDYREAQLDQLLFRDGSSQDQLIFQAEQMSCTALSCILCTSVLPSLRCRSFWELESFGIPSTDHSLYNELRDTIVFQNGRYEVQLPWKTPWQDLPNN